MSIQIDVWYQSMDRDREDHLPLEPEGYFDPLGPGENFAEHGFPRFNYTWQYIDVSRDKLLWSIERRTGTRCDTTFSTQYFDGGKTWINHRSDPNGYEELIHTIDLGETYMTLRTFKQPGGRWVGYMASMCETETDNCLYALPDGTFDLARKLSIRLADVAARD